MAFMLLRGIPSGDSSSWINIDTSNSRDCGVILDGWGPVRLDIIQEMIMKVCALLIIRLALIARLLV